MSQNKRIRLLSVEIFNREPFVYVCDKPRDITIDGKKERRTITNIELVGDYFELYLADGAESKHWKDIPKNDKVTIEYYINN